MVPVAPTLINRSCHITYCPSTAGQVLVVLTSMCPGFRVGVEPCPSQAFHGMDLCTQPHPAVGCRCSTLDAKLKRSTGMHFSATTVLCRLFFHGKADCPWWINPVLNAIPGMEQEQHPTLPDLQYRDAPASLCLRMATGFTAGKQPEPGMRKGPSHVSKVTLSILLQLGGHRRLQKQDSPWEGGPQRCGSCISRGRGSWQGAEEVLQQH